MRALEEQILAVQRMQDHIEAHLGEELGLADLARVSMYSPWYSYRLFVRWVNMTPGRVHPQAAAFRSSAAAARRAGKGGGSGVRAGVRQRGRIPAGVFQSVRVQPRRVCARAGAPVALHPYGVKYRELRKENKMENAKTVFVQLVENRRAGC